MGTIEIGECTFRLFTTYEDLLASGRDRSQSSDFSTRRFAAIDAEARSESATFNGHPLNVAERLRRTLPLRELHRQDHDTLRRFLKLGDANTT